MPRIKLTRLVIILLSMITSTTLLIAWSKIWTELSTAEVAVKDSDIMFNAQPPNSLIVYASDATSDASLNNNNNNNNQKLTTSGSVQTNSDNNKIKTNNNNNDNKLSESRLVGSYQLSAAKEKPWFMANGTKRPTPVMSSLAIWPEDLPNDDRIVNQLMYIPMDYNSAKDNKKKRKKLKKILLYFGRGGWNDLPMGQTRFLADNCPVNRCSLTANQAEAETADAIFFKDRFHWPKHKRWENQVWILFLLECPLHTQLFRNLGYGLFNWTATYRHDSDIVAPYEKFVPYHRFVSNALDGEITGGGDSNRFSPNRKTTNYAEGKTKKVAWFVSNCGARNRRLEYARELSKYIEVDIFGSCGNKKCPRSQAKECFELLNKDYKFYLAFENSNCRDYITEKFYVNGLGHNSKDYNIIPIVMGAHPNDYKRSAPHHSYIHVDQFESAEALANYLHLLDTNDSLYNQYFDWKYSGEFVNTFFWCRVCALLHAPPKPNRFYDDISKWWSPDGVCNGGQQKWDSEQSNNAPTDIESLRFRSVN